MTDDPKAAPSQAALEACPLAEMVERLRAAATAWRDHVSAVEQCNAARPDYFKRGGATPAEKALYDERYKASEEAKRDLWKVAHDLAKHAGENPDLIERLNTRAPSPAVPEGCLGEGERIEDALALYAALESIRPVYRVEGVRVTADIPFSWYVVGPEGEVAFCQLPDGKGHAEMIAAALNDRVAMCALPAAPKPDSPDAWREIETEEPK